MKPRVKVTKKKKQSVDIFKALEAVQKRDTLIGIPQARSTREEEGPNNAELASLHTEGSPAQRIPARPFIQPSIMADKDQIAILQKNVIRAALAGKATLATNNQEKIGLYGQTIVQNWFTDPRNGWPPNAPYTIKMKGSDRPLIDTGQLRQSITYVVRDDGKDLPNF